MGTLTQYGRELAKFDDDTIYDVTLFSNRVGSYTSYGSIYSSYADCLGYSFDDQGKIHYNYDLIAYCENGKVIKWIGGDTIAYYDGDARGAAAAAIIFLFAPKNADEAVANPRPNTGGSDSLGASSVAYGAGGGAGGSRGRGCGFFSFAIFSVISAVMWYFVLTSSETALGHNISLVISAIILLCLLLNAFVFRNKEFSAIFISTLLITSAICMIICIFFDNGGYSFMEALLVSLICVPIVIAALSYIPTLITYLLIKFFDAIESKSHKDSTGK